MSISDYHRDELKRLNEEAARLEVYYQAQSEAVKIDLRRRYDHALAVLGPIRTVWAGIDQATATLKANKESKLPKIVAGLFWVSAAVAWWLWPGHKISLSVAGVLTIYFAIWYAMLRVGAWDLARGLAMLQVRQADYLCQWNASGATDDVFWGHRDRHRNEIKLDALTGPERDEAEKELEASWYVLRHRLRQSLFHRASGTRKGYHADESGKYVLEQDPW